MSKFKDLGLSDKVLGAVERMGYTTPTPVQQEAIPLVLKGRDTIAAAQTGTGKTAAFSLPIMDRLGHAKGRKGPLVLVVTPTRELAQQIGEVMREISLSTHHRIVTVVGGLSYKPQIDRLARGCDVLIATPGRLIDLMEQKAVELGNVEVLVLDEADRMLDMGFLPAMKRIVNATPRSRQTLLFSATIDKSITDVAGSYLRDPAIVEIARKGDVADTVDHYVIRVPQSVKPDLLKALLREKGFYRVIVFARTRSRADSTCRRLKREGYKVETIHSDRSQNQRKRALDHFAQGDTNIITATDVLARGIDIDEVDYVVNYDVPDQPEDYIHRIGRTGRAGSKGLAITFVTPETEGALRDIEKLIKQEIPELRLDTFDMDEAMAESAAKSMQARSGRDPEVRRAKREIANRAQKKTAQDSPAPKRGKSRKKADGRKDVTPQAEGRQRSAKKARRGDPPKQASARKGASKQQKGDFRPGRSHRAEVQRSRSRKRR